MTRLTSAYTNASSEKSPSMICFNEAITIVKKSKNDDTRVNKPTAINKEPIDSENDAIKPKKNAKKLKPNQICECESQPIPTLALRIWSQNLHHSQQVQDLKYLP